MKLKSSVTWWMVLGFVLLVLTALVTPLAIIWSLNTLFSSLAIPYNIWTYLAVIVLNATWLYKPQLKVKE